MGEGTEARRASINSLRYSIYLMFFGSITGPAIPNDSEKDRPTKGW